MQGHPNAVVRYEGIKIQGGSGFLKIPRKDAHRVIFKISEKGCPEQTHQFYQRTFRGWAFVGSLLMSPTAGGVPIPIPNVIDFATGAYWKPNLRNPMIIKEDYKNYHYNLTYDCASKENSGGSNSNANIKAPTKEEKLIELKELLDKGMITEEEYKKSRQEVLNK